MTDTTHDIAQNEDLEPVFATALNTLMALYAPLDPRNDDYSGRRRRSGRRSASQRVDRCYVSERLRMMVKPATVEMIGQKPDSFRLAIFNLVHAVAAQSDKDSPELLDPKKVEDAARQAVTSIVESEEDSPDNVDPEDFEASARYRIRFLDKVKQYVENAEDSDELPTTEGLAEFIGPKLTFAPTDIEREKVAVDLARHLIEAVHGGCTAFAVVTASGHKFGINFGEYPWDNSEAKDAASNFRGLANDREAIAGYVVSLGGFTALTDALAQSHGSEGVLTAENTLVVPTTAERIATLPRVVPFSEQPFPWIILNHLFPDKAGDREGGVRMTLRDRERNIVGSEYFDEDDDDC